MTFTFRQAGTPMWTVVRARREDTVTPAATSGHKQSPVQAPPPIPVSLTSAHPSCGQRQTPEFLPAPTPGSRLSGYTGLRWTSGLFPQNLGHFLLPCRHGSLIWAWRAGLDLQPDMDPGGMPALDPCPLHQGPEGPTLALGGVQSGNPPRRGEVVLTRLDPCRARVTQG